MSGPTISQQQVQHVAELARLALSERESERLRSDLHRILDYMAQLDGLDVSGVLPTLHPLSAPARMRADRPEPSLARKTVLDQAPAHARGAFAVPKVPWDD
ncbi:MAG: Asp-tRNA(Asn)/Glu-tRNA(Gln) amidotransferase subunit GatC [Proteobacteria bacterium]|nr:Asp-tRNA(Asn)/Glu-tRNA(Gln) amidotransferase subunit GatC [Pseudomonadota bacterium]